MTNTALAPLLWDADPTVCCAARQLGACSHSEDAAYEAQVAAEPPAAPLRPLRPTEPADEAPEPF